MLRSQVTLQVLLDYSRGSVPFGFADFGSHLKELDQLPVSLNSDARIYPQLRDYSVPLLSLVAAPSSLDPDRCRLFPLLKHLHANHRLSLNSVNAWPEQHLLILRRQNDSLLLVVFVVNRDFPFKLFHLLLDSFLAVSVPLQKVLMTFLF